MKQILLVGIFLITACAASATGDLGRAPLAQPVSKAPAPPTPPSNLVPVPKAFVCRAFARPSVHFTPEPLEEIRISEPGERSVSSGTFQFRVLYEREYGSDAPTLITFVYSTSTKKLLEQSLFQFDGRKEYPDPFKGHGFTGLRYVYAPDSAAELQYFCSYG